MAGDSSVGYRLHPAAERDLENIWRFTVERWSEEQAERYIEDLVRAFELLVRHPEIAKERKDFQPPVRLHRHQSHLIAYRLEATRVAVVRVLHMRQDWQSALQLEGSGC